jgi:hypothetical protein
MAMSVEDLTDKVAVQLGMEHSNKIHKYIAQLVELERECFEAMDDAELAEKASLWLDEDVSEYEDD